MSISAKGKFCAGCVLLGISCDLREIAVIKKFEGVEWVESAKIKITAQRGGDWMQITQRPENITHTYSRYDGKSYLDKW
jgi:hypothetical protein